MTKINRELNHSIELKVKSEVSALINYNIVCGKNNNHWAKSKLKRIFIYVPRTTWRDPLPFVLWLQRKWSHKEKPLEFSIESVEFNISYFLFLCVKNDKMNRQQPAAGGEKGNTENKIGKMWSFHDMYFWSFDAVFLVFGNRIKLLYNIAMWEVAIMNLTRFLENCWIEIRSMWKKIGNSYGTILFSNNIRVVSDAHQRQEQSNFKTGIVIFLLE